LVAREHARVEVKLQGTPVRLPGQIEMNLLRIAQEAAANAVKHGRAQHVEIELRYTSGAVGLSVSDDGTGFAPSQASPSGHFGLLDMRERAQSMGSQLKIESEPGSGARVSLEVPISNESRNAELKTHTYSGG